MSRLEEMKERTGKTALASSEWMENYRGDVQYLLSKLEAAEKALEECKAYDERANCHWCGGKIKEITTEALLQLRS